MFDVKKNFFTPVEPSVWGPPVWRNIHKLAATAVSTRERLRFKQVMHDYQRSLPCPTCRKHLVAIMKEMPVDKSLDSPESLLRWTWRLHNDVNLRLGKGTVSIESCFDMHHPAGSRMLSRGGQRPVSSQRRGEKPVSDARVSTQIQSQARLPVSPLKLDNSTQINTFEVNSGRHLPSTSRPQKTSTLSPQKSSQLSPHKSFRTPPKISHFSHSPPSAFTEHMGHFRGQQQQQQQQPYVHYPNTVYLTSGTRPEPDTDFNVRSARYNTTTVPRPQAAAPLSARNEYNHYSIPGSQLGRTGGHGRPGSRSANH